MIKKKRNYRKITFIFKLTAIVLFVASIFYIISSNFDVSKVLTYDISKNRSVKAIHLVSKYVPTEVETKYVNTLQEVIAYAKTNPVVFQGTMTGYGPDCDGCGGYLACPPRHNAKNGNIYFNDAEYGKIRILAGDKSIPCGTIVRVENMRGSSPFYAIVLDRGGVIKGTLFDLLYESEKVASNHGRQKITYTLVRWGW